MGMGRKEILEAAAIQLSSRVTGRMLEHCIDCGDMPPITKRIAGQCVYESRHLKAFVVHRQAIESRRKARAEKQAVAS